MNKIHRLIIITSFIIFLVSLTYFYSGRSWGVGEKKAGELEDIVIKGEETQKPSITRPLLQILFDPAETIRDSLNLDESLLLTEHPQIFAWKKTHPQLLYNRRVIQPSETVISEELQIHFNLSKKLSEAMGDSLNKKQVKLIQWTLTIADEQGKVFQAFQGKGVSDQDLVWNGKNDKGEWIKSGHSYSPVYLFTDTQSGSHSLIGKPVQYKGVVHQEDSNLFLSLDSSILFGADKKAKQLQPEGEKLLRSSADWIKRSHFGLSLRIQTYAENEDLAALQANSIRDFLISELMISPQNVILENASAAFPYQRIDLVLFQNTERSK